MNNVMSAIQNTVPITAFNRGMAGKIFEEVKRFGSKVVMKNNVAECVLLSPQEYVALMEEVNDARLFSIAAQRMAQYDPSTAISQSDLEKDFGITSEMLDAVGEVDIE